MKPHDDRELSGEKEGAPATDEQRIRKAGDERAPGVAVSQRAGKRMLRDELHDKLE